MLLKIALPCMLVHINNPSTLEAEIGEGQPRPQTRTVVQNSKQNKEQLKKLKKTKIMLKVFPSNCISI